MRRLLLAIATLTLLAEPAFAGAWLREKGRTFVSTAATAHRVDEQTYDLRSSAYAEWGAHKNVTLGFDVDERVSFAGHALLFVRLPIRNFGKAGRFAVELGAGAYHWQAGWRPLYKFGLSYGNEIQTAWGRGWIATDAAIHHRTGRAPLHKLDLTIGLSTERLINPLLQIETSQIRDQPLYWSVTPSVLLQLSPQRRRKSRVRVAVGIQRNALYTRPGLKFGLWQDF